MKKAQDQNKKTDKSMMQLTKTAANMGAKLATGVAAAATAISTMVIMSAKSAKEMEILSRQAKLTTSEFKSLAFATKQYGINAEQIADISKDVADRLGEFATTGTGTFQDFADVMNLSKSRAQALAVEWQNLSSDQVIGKMVAMMEDAGATGNQMTFVLESMGNDLSKLLPLFTQNSQKLTDLRKDYDDVAGSLQITQEQAQELKKSAENFDLLTTSLKDAGTVISATLAPIFNDFFGDIIRVIPTATQAIVDFINSFMDAENITSIASVNKQIEESEKRIGELREQASGRLQDMTEIQIQGEMERVSALKDQLEVLESQKEAMEDARTFEEDEITGEGGRRPTGGTDTGQEEEALENARPNYPRPPYPPNELSGGGPGGGVGRILVVQTFLWLFHAPRPKG